MNRLKPLFCAAALFLLAGCAANKPSHYYTLMPSSLSAGQPAALAAPGAQASAAGYAISVEAVALPEQVDRPQIVITDPASTQVMPLGDSLWAAPLPHEIQNALSDALSRRLGVLDVAATGIPDTLPVWRVLVRVQRFESLYNQQALLDATWRLTPVNQGSKPSMICRGETRVPVQPGMSALVAGHQQALSELADVIAEQIRSGQTKVDTQKVNLKGCTFS